MYNAYHQLKRYKAQQLRNKYIVSSCKVFFMFSASYLLALVCDLLSRSII